jgi:undecaprenyl pyrophosphate phosphatase UppP
MLATVHVNPAMAAPLGAAAVGALLWYWARLGRPVVPASRRSIRRFVTAMMILTVPLLVLGASVHDPEVNHRSYILTWMGVLVMIAVIVLGALIDVVNNLRLYQQMVHDEITESLRRIAEAERRQHTPGPEAPATENGLP